MAKPTTGEVKVVKKRLVSRAPAKKTPSAKTAKISAKSPSKKTAASRKEKTKIVRVKSLTDDVRKIAIIENITKRKPIAELPPLKQEQVKRVYSRMQLSFSLPFFLRGDQTMLISNVARTAGTFLVVMGAFLTLYSMSTSFPLISGPGLLTAQTATSSPCIDTTCLNGSTLTNSGSGSQTTQPLADIKVESSSNILKGVAPVNVTVPLASRVELVAKRKDSGTVQSIGVMMKVSDLAWRSYWQTTAFDDGIYRIKAIIVNQYGSYTVDDPNEYTIENHPLATTATEPVTTTQTATSTTDSATGTQSTSTTAETTSTTNTTSTTTSGTSNATSTTTTTTLPSVQVSLGMSEPLHGVVSVRTQVRGATTVKIFSRPRNTIGFTILGYATLVSDGEWRYSWDTDKLPDGDYDIRSQALFQNGTSNSDLIESITIEHTTETSTATTSTDTTAATTPPLEPVIVVNLSKPNPVRDVVDLYVTAKVTAVEFYLVPERSIVPQLIGTAEKLSGDGWRYRFDTTRVPNGTYGLYAEARHTYGTSKSSLITLKVQNELTVEIAPEEATYLEDLEKTAAEVEMQSQPVAPDTGEPTVLDASPAFYRALVDDMEDEYKESSEALFENFKGELDSLMIAYGKALRDNNQEEVRNLQNKLEELRARVISELPFGAEKESMVTRINEQLGTVIKDLRERVERSESLIRDRVGDAATKDSDLDGVSDYDEVNLYHTNAFAADTDQDGFTDGIEILNGFDPLDSERESNVQYESPVDKGIVRSDLITIDHLTTVEKEGGDDNAPAQALIGGKGLPNSFVTLYIFSTPIVVTVKTDKDGNWSYLFDKELDDGEHTVYAGITDNVGQIVAKSSPLPFVKTAEAYTTQVKEESAVVASASPEPSLISLRALLIIGSISVISLGLVLILLGLHVRPREEYILPQT